MKYLWRAVYVVVVVIGVVFEQIDRHLTRAAETIGKLADPE